MRRVLGWVLLALCVAVPVSAVAQDVPDACITIRAPGDSGVFVNLPNDTTAESIRHVKDAVAAGQPRILHWKPAEADANRTVSLRGVPLWSRLSLERRQQLDPEHPDAAHQRDEYPPASSDEGGAGADVRYILSADNSRSGQRLGAVMSPYCTGTTFIEEP